MSITCQTISPLDKVFGGAHAAFHPVSSVWAARDERTAFQIACRTSGSEACQVTLEALPSRIADALRIRTVGYTPCINPGHREDLFLITSEPGLFPDPLLPEHVMTLEPSVWRAFWVDVQPGRDAPDGSFVLGFKLHFTSSHGRRGCQTVNITVHIPDFRLPPQKLVNVMWFHADCIMQRYGVSAWSERHWELLGNYFRNMSEHGNNSILTPLWSLPLDTAVGGERPTCQLLQISLRDGRYAFDFTRLARWIALARAHQIDIFEFAHAFTQWGAKHAPKIMVEENGAEVMKFGWHTDAASEAYRGFLRQLMAELIPFLRRHGITKANGYFHVSDEPDDRMLADYRAASDFLHSVIEDYPIIDAMSHIEFLKQGIIRRPVPVVDAIEDFVDEPLEQCWCYYCGNWANGVPNRQFGMPSYRNRAWGVLAYLYRLEGILNWGYNFWFSQFSRDWNLDPWQDPCAGGAFCGGGAFMVYPGAGGEPVDSLRAEIFLHALQDLRALQALESRSGREAVETLILDGAGRRFTFTDYPRDPLWYHALHDKAMQRLQ